MLTSQLDELDTVMPCQLANLWHRDEACLHSILLTCICSRLYVTTDRPQLQAIRGQLQAIAALRDTAATCESDLALLLEDTVAALAEVNDIADQQAELSCLRQARASQEFNLAAERTRLQVQFLPCTPARCACQVHCQVRGPC